jgi:2-polyprenyl-3-methyl-5-hydroxy-6-metoxy-1,4-benzoquinol methylase
MSMIVVHVAVTPLAGSPIQIVNALNRYCAEIRARLIVHSPKAYGRRIFTEDLEWSRDREEALACLCEADIVHLHHFFESNNNPFGIDFDRVCRRARFIRQFHTHPLTIARGDGAQAQRIINSAIPQLVIAQHHERYYPRARIAPNIVPLADDLYKPTARNGHDPVLFFAPTFEHSAWEVSEGSTRWETKGAPETEQLLHKVIKSCGKGRVVVRRNIPHEQCLREKQASDIAIDEMVTGSFHLTSLEALSQGLPTFTYLDGRTLDTLAELTGTHNHPWLNFRLEEVERPMRELIEDAELRREMGAYSRKWMETYYNDQDMVLHYVHAYKDLLERPDKFNKLRFNPNSRRMIWLTQRQDDLIWERRRERFAGHSAALAQDAPGSTADDSTTTLVSRRINRNLSLLKRRLTGVRPEQLCRLQGGLAQIEKTFHFAISDGANRWLYLNRAERMDALDATGIFPTDRQAFHRSRYEFALNYAGNLEVADIACGLGYGCRILKEGGAKAVVGIDSCPEAIVYGRSTHQPTGVTLEVADATRTPLLDSSVDMITSFETIEHIPDTTALLTEFNRILKPQGKLIVSSPNDWGLTEYHCHTWTAFEFMAEIALFFEIESVWEQNSGSTTDQMSRRSAGVIPWSKKTEHQAECLIIVACKILPK